ncbi:MAG: enolase C-terminal domain-like protein [Desulfobacteraceae bacterium]|jgi:muconate cycloisomerase
MKIIGLELFQISIPFAKPYKLSKVYGTRYDAGAVIFKVYTDEGLVGLGEADPLNPFTEETPASVMVVTRDIIAPHIINQDPADIAKLEYQLDQLVHGNLVARGAVNMALFDIVGKINNLPAYMLLGGKYHDKLPLLRGIGSGTPEEDAVAIQKEMENGMRCIMIKMGSLPISDEIKRLIAAQKNFGDQIPFIVDANQGWEVTEALAFVVGIGDCRPDLIEQPIHRKNIHGLKRIRERSPCPLSADESLVTIQDATTLIREQAVDVFSLKVSKNGGLSKTRKIAETADAFGLKCLMNSMLEFGITQAASLHVGCTLTNLVDFGHAYGSVLRMSDDVTDFGQNISEGIVTVPRAAGLGVALDEDKLKKYTVDYLKIGRTP